MTEEKFNKLLEQLNNNTYIKSNVSIWGDTGIVDYEGEYIDINDEKAILLVEAINKNPTITELNLPNHLISEDGAVAISTLANIKELNLNGNSIGVKGTLSLLKNNTIEILSLSTSRIFNSEEEYEQSIDLVIDAFVENTSIIKLDLSKCYLKNIFVSKIIQQNKTIKSLDVSDNYLTDESIKFISDNNTLKELYINGNEITNTGMQNINDNTSLKKLSASSKLITGYGLVSFLSNKNLEEIYITNSTMELEDIKDFYQAFEDWKIERAILSQQSLPIDSSVSKSYEQEIVYDKNQDSESSDIIGQLPDYD